MVASWLRSREQRGLVVLLDADTSFFASRTTEVCWRLLFEGRVYRSNSVVSCAGATPLQLLRPDQETVPADAVERLRRVLVDRDPSASLRAEIESEFPELNSRNVEIISRDGVYGVALDDGVRCVIGRAGRVVDVRELDDDSIEQGFCSPAIAVGLVEGRTPGT